jgi:hypothetical protein
MFAGRNLSSKYLFRGMCPFVSRPCVPAALNLICTAVLSASI